MGKERPFFSLAYVGGRFTQKVGPQENKGVFLSFTLGSSYESGLALGSTLIAGGLKATWGPHASLSEAKSRPEIS